MPDNKPNEEPENEEPDEELLFPIYDLSEIKRLNPEMVEKTFNTFLRYSRSRNIIIKHQRTDYKKLYRDYLDLSADYKILEKSIETKQTTNAFTFGCHIDCCVTMYNEKVLNPVQTWLPGFSAICLYTTIGMASTFVLGIVAASVISVGATIGFTFHDNIFYVLLGSVLAICGLILACFTGYLFLSKKKRTEDSK
jgi:hypothetical protein